MTKQCIVFIDDNSANNELQTAELCEKLKEPSWMPLDISPSLATQLKDFNLENIYAYRHGYDTELWVASLNVELETQKDGNDAAWRNQDSMKCVGEKLSELKLKLFHTVLPVVDLCLCKNSKMDNAWTINMVENFFSQSLSGFRIKILTSAVANVLVQNNIENLKKCGVLFVPRPIIQEENHFRFDEDASSVSTCEAAFFVNLLESNNIVAKNMPPDFLNLFRELCGTYKKYERYFYSIMVANEILLYLPSDI